jgi:hypothetical protein
MARTPRPVPVQIAPVAPGEPPTAATPFADRLWPNGDSSLTDPATTALDSFIEEFGYLMYRKYISAVRLQGYVGDEVIFERACIRSDRRLEPGGYRLDPALAPLAEDARVRIVVTPDHRAHESVLATMFLRHGWPPAPALRRPEADTARAHMVELFESAVNGKTLRLYLVHQLYVNPKFSLGEYRRAMGIKPPWLRER